MHFVHPELDPDVVRIDPGAVVNWGRTSAHAHAPVPSGRVPMWGIEVLLHRLPRFECSSVFSHLDIHDRVDQCVFTPGYPVIPHQRLSCTVGSSPPLLGWRPGEGANCAISIWRYPAFPGALNAPQGTQSPLKRPRMRGSRPDGRPPASAFPEIAPELRVAGDDRISTPQAG